MDTNNIIYKNYLDILQSELIQALGCTEPVSIAFASAKAREILGHMPTKIIIKASGGLIKNSKSVVVPNSNGLKGIKAAAILGTVGGNPNKGLETLTDITEQNIETTKEILNKNICEVEILETPLVFHFQVFVFYDNKSAFVEVANAHTNIICIKKDSEIIFEAKLAQNENHIDRSLLNIRDILEFANTVKLSDVQELIENQINCNCTIAKEGMEGNYGIRIGHNLLKYYSNDIKLLARATAAAGSDARMSGCALPVVINSGSGNQGLTVSLPVIEYAKHLNSTKEQTIRALVLSNLIAIHQKTTIGLLSAYCGAISAAAACGAGITYLYGGGYDKISDTITNTLATTSGIICDGAKPSCAAKISQAIDAAIMGHCLAMDELAFLAGDGIVKTEIEGTIAGVGSIASPGMHKTNEQILDVMLNQQST